MAEYDRWWLNRVGALGGATVTAAQPEPIYSAAIDLGAAATQPLTYEDMVNAVQTMSDEQNAELWLNSIARQGMPVAQTPEPVPPPKKEPKIKGWGDFFGDLGTSNPLENLGARASFVMNQLSGVDEETGVNRTERKWLEAQRDQASDIKLQHDAELDPELRMMAEHALETGEWTEELALAYTKYQNKFAGLDRGLDIALEGLETAYQQGVARPISTGIQVLGTPFSEYGEASPFEGETWRDAWERQQAGDISPGRALTDLSPWAGLGEERLEAYAEGFDEFGNPRNQAYADLRKSGVYNVVSGTTDFAVRWYLDPAVLAGRAAGATRAVVRADWDRMPVRARSHIMQVVSTPAERWNDVRAGLNMANPVTRRAVSLREEMYGLRDKIRQAPEEWDPVRLAQEVPALKDDLLNADLFRELAMFRRQTWDADQLKSVDALDAAGNPVYDDSLWETGVAALMGNGAARAELAARKELDDFFYYTTSDESILLTRDVEKLKFQEHLESQLADFELRSGQVLAASDRWARVRSMRETMEQKSERGLELDAQLQAYDKYNRFMNATLDGADATFLRYGQFKPREHKYSRITHQTLKPSGAAGTVATVTHIPRSAWLTRSSAIDLSGHQGLQTQAPRIIDETAKAVGDVDTLNAYALDKGHESWDDMTRTVLNRAAGTRLDTERRQVAMELEEMSIGVVAAKHGLTPDQALAVLQRVRGRRGEMFADIRKRTMDAKAQGANLDDIKRYTYAEGNQAYHLDMPMSLTQLENYHVPVSARDMDRFLTQYGDALKNSFRSTIDRGREFGTDALDIFNTFWKVGVLFRFGYPIRNVSEESLRILGHTGTFTNLLADMPRAAGIGMVNTGKRIANMVWRHSPNAAKWTGARFQYRDHQGRTREKLDIGGNQFNASFAPGVGDIWLDINSAKGSVDRLAQTFERSMLSLRKEHMGTRRTLEGEAGHAEAWAHVLNNQVRYDPIYRRMLQGETDDQIVHWLQRSVDGAEILRRNPVRGADPDKWITEMRAELDELAPDDVDDIRAALLADDDISPKFLQQIIDDQDRYSPVSIDEASLQLTTGRGSFAEGVYGLIDRGYHVLATLPTDILARNPFFDRQYRGFLQRLTDDLPDDYGPLSATQTRAFEAQARSFALTQTKRYLFNTVDNDTDLIHWFRFLSPFMGAWKESMKAWGRIITENPESFVRLYVNGWESMGDLFFVTETDANGRTADDPLHGDLDRLQLAVPKGVIRALGYTIPGDTGKQFRDVVDELADEDGAVRVGVTKTTLNTTLQGDPFWLPGGGAIVQLSANAVIGDMPELADENTATAFLYKYLFPIGAPDNAWDAIAPTLVRRVMRFAQGMKDPVFSNTSSLLYKAEWMAWERGGRVGPPPDKVEIVEKAKSIQAAYIVGAIGSPFSFELESHAQFFVDKAHQYQEEFGFEDGYTKFIEDFGDDVYYFWYTNSKNNVGVPPTSDGWKMTKKHEDLIARYPMIGLAIVGMQTQDSPFNYNVWAQQARTETYPGSGTLMRDRRTPEEAVDYAQAQEGWQKWRQLSTAIDAELVARGITDIVNGEVVAGSIQRKGAEDLQYLKAQYREQLRVMYPGWSAEYDQIDKGTSYQIIDEFRGVLRSGQMGARVEWEGVAQYMELHDAVATELDARAQAGGSANIENETNQDLLAIFNGNVARLVQSNLMFADIYHRFLERHTLTNGSNGAQLGF